MQRTQFTFYDSYYEAAQKLRSKKDRANFISAVCDYSLYGMADITNLTAKAQILFASLLPLMDADIRASTEGRHSTKYKAWRLAVYRRDDYTCCRCGARGVRLNAHHIKGYAHYPELRYEVSNGITLCEECHKKEHRRK